MYKLQSEYIRVSEVQASVYVANLLIHVCIATSTKYWGSTCFALSMFTKFTFYTKTGCIVTYMLHVNIFTLHDHIYVCYYTRGIFV